MPVRARPSQICLCVVVFVMALPAWAVDAERVTFETYDGMVICADYYGPKPSKTGAPMVILLHMYRSDRAAWQPLIKPLHEAGFAILAIDMRGHGECASAEARRRVERRDPGVFRAMYDDVRAAYTWLAEQDGVDRSRFALVGASVGCSVALRYATQDRSVDVIVCLSPGANYLGLDSKADISRIKSRKIWLVAADDPKEKQGVEALALLADDADTELFPGNAHGTRMFGKVPGLEKQIADYLSRYVGGPTGSTVYGSINSKIYHLPGSGWIGQISPANLRHYSSPQEAEARGLRKARSRGPTDRPWRRREP
ncbi:MAG: alpha/beta hydrolase [Phycisphaerae bacterium]